MQVLQAPRKNVLRHLIVWTVITSVITIIDPPSGILSRKIVVTLLLMGNYMIAYYLESIIIFPKYFGKNALKLVLGVLLALVIYELIQHMTFFVISPMFGSKTSFDSAPPYTLLLNSIFLFFCVSIVAFGGYQNNISKLNIKIQNEREKVMLIKELGFFKNQFNSHIVFNFLNFCYSHIHKESQDGAKAIERFSKMLRYTLDNKPDKPVPLQNEIEHINNFISLHRQLTKNVHVDFRIHGKLKGFYIYPRVLINFIENAFKHGEIASKEIPITIYLEAFDNQIKLSVRNKKKSPGNQFSPPE
jgi:two-component system LytT family sensor kinase